MYRSLITRGAECTSSLKMCRTPDCLWTLIKISLHMFTHSHALATSSSPILMLYNPLEVLRNVYTDLHSFVDELTCIWTWICIYCHRKAIREIFVLYVKFHIITYYHRLKEVRVIRSVPVAIGIRVKELANLLAIWFWAARVRWRCRVCSPSTFWSASKNQDGCSRSSSSLVIVVVVVL